jgi:uncharacterized protein YbaR (Trm112 family)
MAKCPYCKQELSLERTRRESIETTDSPDSVEEVHKDVSGLVKKEVMYSCPHCDSILGFSFFFGGVLTGRPR